MLDNRKHIDNLFKENFEKRVESPPAFIWDNIEENLNDSSRLKNQLSLWKSIAAAGLLLFVSSTLFFLNRTTNTTLESSFTSNSQTTAPGNKTINYTGTPVASSTPHVMGENMDTRNRLLANLPSQSDNSSLQQTTITRNTTPELRSIAIITSNDEVQNINTQELKSQKQKKEYQPLYFIEASSKTQTKKNLSIGGSVSPNYNRNNSSHSSNQLAYTNESPSLGGGINISISGKSRWSIESGVLYSKLNQNIQAPHYEGSASMAPGRHSDANYSDIIISQNKQALKEVGILTPATTSPESDLRDIQLDDIKQSYEYIEVPLLAKYTIIKGKPSINILGGVSSNFLINNQTLIKNKDNTSLKSEAENIKPVTISSSIGMGLEMPITKAISFSLEPRLKYYLNTINSNSNTTFKPYTLGFFGGIKVNL